MAAPRVARRLTSSPPGAVVSHHGEVIGKTPIALELPQSDAPEPFTLRLADHVEQTVEIVPREAGTTDVVLARVPRRVVHELGCDPGCEAVLDGAVVGTAAPGRSYRSEFLDQPGQLRSYVLRPLDQQHRATSYRAAADRSVKALVHLPCAPRDRTDASLRPHVYDPYDSCNAR